MQMHENPVTRLSQRWGPFECEWVLFPDRVEVARRSPLGVSRTPVELIQIECFTFLEEPPRPLVVLAGAASLVFLTLFVISLLSPAGSVAVVVAGLLALTLAVLMVSVRQELIQIETVGGKRFRLLGDEPSRPDVEGFLQLVRQLRTHVLTSGPEGWEAEAAGFLEGPEELDDWGERDSSSTDEEPIDPRWIN